MFVPLCSVWIKLAHNCFFKQYTPHSLILVMAPNPWNSEQLGYKQLMFVRLYSVPTGSRNWYRYSNLLGLKFWTIDKWQYSRQVIRFITLSITLTPLLNNHYSRAVIHYILNNSSALVLYIKPSIILTSADPSGRAWVCSRWPAEITGSNPARGMDVCLLWVLWVCQVEVSATGWSLVQRSPTDCGVSLCVIS
jgi:hypothetical protein